MAAPHLPDVFPFNLPIITLDYESYYDAQYGLKKFTTEAYVRDPQWETIGCGVRMPDGTTEFLEHAEFKEFAAYTDWSKYATVAHNAYFDSLIAYWHYGIVPAFNYDTLSMAIGTGVATEVGGSLGKVMEHFGVGQKGDEVKKVMGMHRKDFDADAFARYAEYCKTDVGGAWDIFQRLLAFDGGYPADELKLISITIKMFSEPVLVLDEPRMRTALANEQARKRALLMRVAGEAGVNSQDPVALQQAIRYILGSNPKFAEVLLAMGVTPPTKWSVKKGKMDFAFAKTDPGMQAFLDSDNEEVKALAEARLGIKSTGMETRTQRLLRAGVGGRPLPVYLKYCGAHTTRYSGGDKSNMQNLQKTNEVNSEKGAIRKSLLAPKGKKIVAADAAQIEARINAWLAGQDDLLDAFREKGRDPYGEFGAIIYGRPIFRKTVAADEVPGHVAKVAVLGLGYGMGPLKFAITLSAGANGGPPVTFGEKELEMCDDKVADAFMDNEDYMTRVRNMPTRLTAEKQLIHCLVANDIVKKYRKKNHKIVAFWRTMEDMLSSMAQGGGYELRNDNGERIIEAVAGGCGANGGASVVLPSGLRMRYPEFRFTERVVEEGEDEADDWKNRGHYSYYNPKEKKRVKIYGGAMCENVVQALARCVTMGHMVQFDDYLQAVGGRTVLTVHDEVVGVVDDAHAKEATGMLVELMKVAPKWAEGCPLSAEGGFGDVYGEI